MSFVWFDEMSWQDKPALIGWEPLEVIYEGRLFRNGTGSGQSRLINERYVRESLIPSIPSEIDIICLDVENYEMTDENGNLADTIRKMNRILDIFHEDLPGVRIGYYRLLRRDVHRSTSGDRAQIMEWRAENEALGPIRNKTDIEFPSLYTFNDNEDRMIDYMKRNLDEQFRITKDEIYPFIWPRYHPSNQTLGGQEIPGRFWQKIVQAVLDHNTNGIVFWNRTPTIPWVDRGDWWKVTEMLRTEGIRSLHRGSQSSGKNVSGLVESRLNRV